MASTVSLVKRRASMTSSSFSTNNLRITLTKADDGSVGGSTDGCTDGSLGGVSPVVDSIA